MRMTNLEKNIRQRLSEMIRMYVKEDHNYQHLVNIVKYINSLDENRLGYWNYTITRCISLMFAEGELNTGCRDFYKVIDLLERLKFELMTTASSQQQTQRRQEISGASQISDLARLVRFASSPPNCMLHEDREYLVGVLETVKQKFFRKVVYSYEDK